MSELQEELKARKRRSDKIVNDCPLCLDTSVGKVPPITGTTDEINRVASANDMCQPCSQCSHPFHKGCVSNLTNHSGLVKLSKCPICRSNNFKEGQLQVENERTKKLIVEIGERIKKSQIELTLINSEIKNSADPDVLTELQNRLDSLEKKIDLDERLLNIYISNDYDGSMSAED
jgi:MinD superfamily P-loop ATPase